jgi:hypothetical protein
MEGTPTISDCDDLGLFVTRHLVAFDLGIGPNPPEAVQKSRSELVRRRVEADPEHLLGSPRPHEPPNQACSHRYRQLTLPQRYEIFALKKAGHSQVAIAGLVGVHASSG